METKRIIVELEAERDRLDEAIRAIESISSDGASRPTRHGTATTAPMKRRMSAATRRRLSLLLTRRWAQGKMKGRTKPRANFTKPTARKGTAKKAAAKGSMSAAARKRISEARKKWWADRKKVKTAT
jgi:hypothetical protein